MCLAFIERVDLHEASVLQMRSSDRCRRLAELVPGLLRSAHVREAEGGEICGPHVKTPTQDQENGYLRFSPGTPNLLTCASSLVAMHYAGQ